MGNYLKHKMQMEKDDLKDCSMLMDYAEEAKAHGEKTLGRLQNFV